MQKALEEATKDEEAKKEKEAECLGKQAHLGGKTI